MTMAGQQRRDDRAEDQQQRREDRAEDQQQRREDRAEASSDLAAVTSAVQDLDHRLGRIETQLWTVLAMFRWMGFGGVAALIALMAIIGARLLGIDLP